MALIDAMKEDSPLSITASIAGILTLLFAVGAVVMVWMKSILESERELAAAVDGFQSLMAEEKWMNKLFRHHDGLPPPFEDITQMYQSAKSELDRLHRCLFRTFYNILVVKTMENFADIYSDWERESYPKFKWFLEQFRKIDNELYRRFYRSRRGQRTRWLGARSKVFELLKQREAMRSRVMVLQLSMLDFRFEEAKCRELEQQEATTKMRDIMEEMKEMIQSGSSFRDDIVPEYRSAINAAGIDEGDITDEARVESSLLSQQYQQYLARTAGFAAAE